jgi:hypothetical protein
MPRNRRLAVVDTRNRVTLGATLVEPGQIYVVVKKASGVIELLPVEPEDGVPLVVSARRDAIRKTRI